MDPTMVPAPMTDFERGLAYGEMKSEITRLSDRISRLEYERDEARETATRAEHIATDALNEAIEARDEIADVSDEIEHTTDTLETIAIADAVADNAVSEAVEELADEIATDDEHGESDVTVVDDGGTDETPRQEPEVEHDKPVKHHRRGGVYGRRR